jgi:hypothetical protein
MSISRTVVAAVSLVMAAACAHGPAPQSVEDLNRGLNWSMDPGAKLAASLQRDMSRMLKGRNTGDALSLLAAGGYECATGEGGMTSVCTRSFATRACQLDWTTTLSATEGTVRKVDAAFVRDCVTGGAGDWPVEKKSAIDDQLAPPPADLGRPASN